ncbi:MULTISPECIES: DUF1269 domain-containing protein [Methanosarcina]|uniref:Uncharacterized protein n=1 Tax=Methanosarcina vacuolata Z-761 TaxID=1434123 RepID=A0A0E3LHB2_9EURY|nr:MULTISPECIES: DUF1269 domain-containing protein [Methanosarcina]AKB43966.1 hypothetical protein MSVAZ_1697 [Methanosarcina vacuolata Z-761]AKB47436.1 hypothetical protein MSKOL_1659 [Methanosarcina sp. Kolksee]
MTHAGISENFIKSVCSEVIEGASALFLMTSDAIGDRVEDSMKQF